MSNSKQELKNSFLDDVLFGESCIKVDTLGNITHIPVLSKEWYDVKNRLDNN